MSFFRPKPTPPQPSDPLVKVLSRIAAAIESHTSILEVQEDAQQDIVVQLKQMNATLAVIAATLGGKPTPGTAVSLKFVYPANQTEKEKH
jgi:hypothetical protein